MRCATRTLWKFVTTTFKIFYVIIAQGRRFFPL